MLLILSVDRMTTRCALFISVEYLVKFVGYILYCLAQASNVFQIAFFHEFFIFFAVRGVDIEGNNLFHERGCAFNVIFFLFCLLFFIVYHSNKFLFRRYSTFQTLLVIDYSFVLR